MHRQWRCAVVVMALLVSACAEGPTGNARDARVVMNFLTPATVRTVVVEVSGPGLSPAVVVNIPVAADSTARDTLILTAGAGRRFVVTALDSAGVTTHRADTTITLQAGVNAPLAMRLEPLPSTLGITVMFGGVRLVLNDTSTVFVVRGDTASIAATAIRSDGTTAPNDSLEWGSSNPAIATVAGGLVRGAREGATTISVAYMGAVVRRGVVVTDGPPAVAPPEGATSVFLFEGALSNSVNPSLAGSGASVTYTANRFGAENAALLFSGTYEVSLPSAVVDDLPSGSLGLWLRHDAGTEYTYVLTKNCGSTECDASRVFFLTLNGCADGNGLPEPGPTGRVCWQTGNYIVAPANFPFPSTVEFGQWNHVAITWGDGRLSLYRNGVLAQSVDSCSGCIVRSNLGYPVVLGLGSTPANTGGFRGAIDDLVVYPRALTAAEVFDLSRVVR